MYAALPFAANAPPLRAHVHPIDPTALDSVGNAVQRVTDDPVTGLSTLRL
jgi:hypothetical protein